MDGQTDRWMDGRMDGWMDRHKDRWMVGRLYIVHVWIDGWMDRYRVENNSWSMSDQCNFGWLYSNLELLPGSHLPYI